MATTWVAQNPRRVGNASSVVPAMASLLVDGDATFQKGQFCRLASDGLIYEGTTGTALGVGDDAITHQATTTLAAAGTVDTVRKTFAVVHTQDMFLMHELDGAFTAAMQGQIFDMDVTLNICTVETASNTNPVFRLISPNYLVNPYDGDTVSDVIARGVVKVLATAINAVPTN